MREKTCAACDCPLDVNAIKVRIGGKPVAVCGAACAQKLTAAAAVGAVASVAAREA